MDIKKPPVLFIYGPTAVGKTEFAEKLALAIPAEIINMDSAQCYTALKIGTAKPDWQSSMIPCHLFDILSKPVHSSVTEYRKRAVKAIHAIQQRGKIPIFVGGSGFYLMSLLYPPINAISKSSEAVSANNGTWDDLYAIDPDRAMQIYKNDQYRIDRAIAIWQRTGIKPSLHIPIFDPPSDFTMFFLSRDRQKLHDRIKQRVEIMLHDGFVQEVQSLSNEWHAFLEEKKIIGYPDVLNYVRSKQTIEDYQQMKFAIAHKTAGYAKRQWTFWRMLTRKLADTKLAKKGALVDFKTEVINLTLPGLDLYIKQLSNKLLSTMKLRV